MQIAIIETTINIPHNLVALARNMKEHDHDDVLFLIIGDMQTPPEAQDIADEIRGLGLSAEYWNMETQRALAREHPCLRQVPIRSGLRRNIGTLLALKYKAEAAVYVDDDNWPLDGEDFLTEHIVGRRREYSHIDSKWWNPLWAVALSPNIEMFARGYPLSRRACHEVQATPSRESVTVVASQGLFTGVPDLDAFCHLTVAARVEKAPPYRVVLLHTYCPMNTQNTAVGREVLPAYHFPDLGRNFDIIAGYFLQRVAYRMGYGVSVGPPVLEHRRNAHDYLKDLESELPGLKLIDQMVPILESPAAPNHTVEEACLLTLGEFNGVFSPEVRQGYLDWFEEIAKFA